MQHNQKTRPSKWVITYTLLVHFKYHNWKWKSAQSRTAWWISKHMYNPLFEPPRHNRVKRYKQKYNKSLLTEWKTKIQHFKHEFLGYNIKSKMSTTIMTYLTGSSLKRL